MLNTSLVSFPNLPPELNVGSRDESIICESQLVKVDRQRIIEYNRSQSGIE